MVLPVASTVLPASSRMRGVGLEGAWNLVCEEEGGKKNFNISHFTGSMLHYQHWAVVKTYPHGQTYLSPGFPRPESCSVCEHEEKS